MKYFSLILSILISIIFLEFFVRFYIDDGMNYEIEMMKYANQLKVISKNKEIGIEHKKNKKGIFMGAELNLNSKGFRNNREFKKNSKKILMLGDSMTLGWGARTPFANILNDKFSNYEVINAGIGNTNTIMQIENFFVNFKDQYNYKIIILNFFINDFEDIKLNKPNFFQRYSFLYTYFSNSLNTILIKFKINKKWDKFYSESYKNQKIKGKVFNKILKLKNYCDQNNIRLIIHNIPELRDLKNYKFENETRIIKEFSNNNDIEFINSHDALINYKESDLWVTKADSHANDKAHKIIAEFINSKVKKYLD
tara:strand:- start:2121 stop:3050 length:930 start_codon:yes stop_codon:yes gene_type:complete